MVMLRSHYRVFLAKLGIICRLCADDRQIFWPFLSSIGRRNFFRIGVDCRPMLCWRATDNQPTIGYLSSERRPMGWNIGPSSVDVGELPTDAWQTSADNIPILGPITSADSFGIVGRDHLNHGFHTNHIDKNVSRWWFDQNIQNTPRYRPTNPGIRVY
jgi:hypothetical protein